MLRGLKQGEPYLLTVPPMRMLLWRCTCTRALYESEIKENYEEETGKVIVETFHEQELDPLAVPGVLVYGHTIYLGNDSGKSS